MRESAGSRIERVLRRRIQSLPPGAKIPNEMELCGEFSVSRMTMNKVIAKLVQEDLVYRVRKKGSFVKERRTPETPIYFLLPVIDYLAYNQSLDTRRALAGLSMAAAALNRKIEFVPVTRTNVLDDFDWDRLSGIPRGAQIFIMGYWYKKLFPFFNEKECETVIINSGIWIEDEYKKIISGWYSITVERKAGTEDAVSYLTRQGRKKPLLLYTYKEPEHPVTEGFKSGLRKAGLEFQKELFICAKPPSLSGSWLKELHTKHRFDSVILGDVSIAKTVIDALKNADIRIPEDAGVICLDEHSALTELTPPVSASAAPFLEMGREAARIFNREIFLPGETRFHHTLIERESTRKGAKHIIDLEYLPELNIFESPLLQAAGGMI
jgi:hypothetical protein